MQTLTNLEGSILLFIQEHIRCAALDGIMRVLSALGDMGAVWIAVAVVFLCARRDWRKKLLPAVALLLSLLVTNLVLKNLIHRIRPYDAFSALHILVGPERDFSFPSGHASSSFAAAWALWRGDSKRYGVPALILATLISLSRLYVGVHYPTDVLCGALIGILCGEMAHRLTARIPAKR